MRVRFLVRQVLIGGGTIRKRSICIRSCALSGIAFDIPASLEHHGGNLNPASSERLSPDPLSHSLAFNSCDVKALAARVKGDS